MLKPYIQQQIKAFSNPDKSVAKFAFRLAQAIAFISLIVGFDLAIFHFLPPPLKPQNEGYLRGAVVSDLQEN